MKPHFKEGMRVKFNGKYYGILGAYDEGWYIKTTDHFAAWPWDCRLPSVTLNRGDLCYWVSEPYITSAKTKLGNEL